MDELSIRQRIEELNKEYDSGIAIRQRMETELAQVNTNLHAIEGALLDCQFWLNQLDQVTDVKSDE